MNFQSFKRRVKVGTVSSTRLVFKATFVAISPKFSGLDNVSCFIVGCVIIFMVLQLNDELRKLDEKLKKTESFLEIKVPYHVVLSSIYEMCFPITDLSYYMDL